MSISGGGTADREVARLDRGDGVELAYARIAGRAPMIVFLPGYRSDMNGTKAAHLAEVCAATGQAMLRFDYSGHGASAGRFEDGTIGIWVADTLAVIDRVTQGSLILVGSSMGGWVALLTALARPRRVAALVGVAAAPDFTESLMWAAMMPSERERLMRDGLLHVPSQYGPPFPITRALIEDGRTRLLLDHQIAICCPVRLLHGQRDPDVPWETSLRLAERLVSEDVRLTLIKDGDHRLSRPQDLDLLTRALAEVIGQRPD